MNPFHGSFPKQSEGGLQAGGNGENLCQVHVSTIKSQPGQISRQCANFYGFATFISFFLSRLEMKVTKSSGGVPRLSYTGRDDRHFLPTGLYIIKTFNGTYSWRVMLHFGTTKLHFSFYLNLFEFSFMSVSPMCPPSPALRAVDDGLQ